MTCPVTISFDIGVTSGLYAGLTGVLAGFSFTAVVIGVTRFLDNPPLPPETKEKLIDAMPAMICSFLGLVITSLTYSAIAGDGTNTGRSTVEELIGGIAFSMSGSLMLFAIVQLMQVVAADDAAKNGRRALGQFIQLIGFAYICNGMDDYISANYPKDAPGWLYGIVYGLLFIFLVYAILGYAFYYRLHGRFRLASSPDAVAKRIPSAALVSVMAASVAVGLVSSNGSACDTPPVIVPIIILVIAFVVNMGFSVWLFLTRPPDALPLAAPSGGAPLPTIP